MRGERCRQFVRELGDCLEGIQFDAHLQACPKCRLLLETTRRTVQLYRARGPCCIPPEVESRLMAAMAARMKARTKTPAP